MTIIQITGPAVEPLTVGEVKEHLHIDAAVADDDFDGMIRAAREEAEALTGRSLISRTWERVLHEFPAGGIELGWPPVLAITSIKYIDTAGVEQTLAVDHYTLDEVTTPGWVYPSIAYPTWPDTQSGRVNAVRVRFTAGYGTSAGSVPHSIRQWMKTRIGTMYTMREEVVTGVSVKELDDRYTLRLLDPHRVLKV
jgi:uncharacterized phiE125 gp8 family phage protein